MKRVKFNIIIVAITAISLVAVSCSSGSSVDAALSQIDKAMSKVEKNKTSMSEADWKSLEVELEQPLKVLNEALESQSVSALKKIKISAAVFRYAAVLGEAALHTATDSLKVFMEDTQIADSISGAIDKLQETLTGDEMKEAMKELQKATEELQKIAK